ncbi:MAG: translocation/assembly module TamB, partial [Gemmatimonadaceae bacterium]|nr:translocation/assembly module TamB [Gemmatimonadaceae bacterium]
PRLARGLPPVSTRIVPPPPIRRDSIDGAVRALARVRGNVDDVSVIADLTASQLAVGGNVARRIALGVDLEHWRTAATSARLVTTVNDVNAAGYQVDSARAQATYAWRDRRVESGTGRLALRARFLDSTEVGIDGALAVDDRSYAARVDSTSLRLPTSAWANTTPWRARWADGRLTIDSLVLETAGDARLALDAAIDTAGRATATLVLRNTQVRDLADLAQARTPADGRVSLDVYLDGTARDPKIQFLGAIRDIVLDGDSLPEARLRFTYAAREMQAVSELRRAGQQPTLRATATIPIDLALTGATTRLLDTPLTADIRMDSLDLAELPELSESVTDLKGVAVGRVQVRGTLPDDLRFEGQLALRDGGAFVVPVELTVEPIIADLKLRGDSIVVDSIRAKSGDGWTTIRGGISVTKATNPVFDLTLVSRNARFFDGQMGRMRGFTDLTLTGPYRDARIEGSVRIRNGFYYLPDGGKDVTVLSADDPTVFSAVDSSLAVARGLVTPPSDFVRGLKMNVSARVDRDVWVRGSALNVEVFTDGEVLASVNPATGLVTLDGTVSTERGQYQFFGKRFNVVRGSATFLPETPATNPLLQAIAEYSVRQAASQTLAIRLNIGGTLERPRLSLESDAQPPVPQSDLISYLAFGRNTGTLLSQEGAGLSGAGAQGSFVGATAALLSAQLAPVALGIALDQVEGNVSRWLGADVLNITAVEVPPELFRANLTRIATVLNDFTEVEYGRYFGTRTYIGVNARPSLLFGSTTSATRPVPGVRWEYRFTRNYRIETTFGPRFLVQPPTLQPQIVQPRGAFGLFVSREWKNGDDRLPCRSLHRNRVNHGGHAAGTAAPAVNHGGDGAETAWITVGTVGTVELH